MQWRAIVNSFMPTSSAVFTAKNGTLSLIKDGRPLALLTSDYRIISKCSANRLKHYLHLVMNKDQTYCISNRSVLMCDMLDIWSSICTSTGSTKAAGELFWSGQHWVRASILYLPLFRLSIFIFMTRDRAW